MKNAAPRFQQDKLNLQAQEKNRTKANALFLVKEITMPQFPTAEDKQRLKDNLVADCYSTEQNTRLSVDEEDNLLELIIKLRSEHESAYLQIYQIAYHLFSEMSAADKTKLKKTFNQILKIRRSEKMNGHFNAISGCLDRAVRKKLAVATGEEISSPMHFQLEVFWQSFIEKKDALYLKLCQLTKSHRWLALNQASYYARRYRLDKHLEENLIQEGMIGIWLAANRYRPDHWELYQESKSSFSKYAYWWAKRNIKRAVQEYIRYIRLPFNIIERMGKVACLQKSYRQSNGQKLSLSEAARKIGLKEKQIKRLKQAQSIDLPISSSRLSSPEGQTYFQDSHASKNNQFDSETKRLDCQKFVNQMLSNLTKREVEILERRFGLNGYDEHTLEEISKLNKISRERVRQIVNQSFKKLRRQYQFTGLRDFLN